MPLDVSLVLVEAKHDRLGPTNRLKTQRQDAARQDATRPNKEQDRICIYHYHYSGGPEERRNRALKYHEFCLSVCLSVCLSGDWSLASRGLEGNRSDQITPCLVLPRWSQVGCTRLSVLHADPTRVGRQHAEQARPLRDASGPSQHHHQLREGPCKALHELPGVGQ